MHKIAFVLLLDLSWLICGCGDDGAIVGDTGVVGDAAADTAVTSDVGPADGGDGGPGDGGADATFDAAGADGGGVPGEIMCGRNICDAATQECCIVDIGEGETRATCITAGDTCDGATAICDGPEDCGADESCCGRVDPEGGTMVIECTDAAECSGLGTGGLELCHDRSDCTESTHLCCPIVRTGFSGMVCSESCVGG